MRDNWAKQVRWLSMLVIAAGVSTTSFAGNDRATDSDSSEPGQTVHAYHDGSIRDVDAIGNRNVGCGRGVGNWYSLEKQIGIGKTYAQQVESTARMVNDPVVTEYVNRLGQNLVRNSDARVPFTIKVIDSDEINAFALPGGFFYVNSGLILAADNEAELAGVMAHEIGHVAACHAAREQTRGELASLASIPLIFAGGVAGYAAVEAASVALPVGFLKFSRGFEAQADYLGVEYMYKAGYDPQAFLSFFEKIEAKEKKKPGTVAKVFATHPPTPDRMRATQEEISSILPPQNQYILDTSEFDDVKARLAAIENGHKMQNDKDNDQPTLRKAQRKPNSNNGDDHPTLKRRTDQNGPETTGS
jgi:predicted Zn-dependent protease